MSNWGNLLKSDTKWKVFGYILLLILIVGTLLSLITKMTFIEDDKATRPKIAVIAPDTKAGQSLKQGVRHYVDTINSNGGHNGRLVELLELNVKGTDFTSIASDEYLKGVVGFLDREALLKYHSAFTSAGIPLATPVYLEEVPEGVVSLGSAPEDVASFAANYARNISQQRIMYVIRQSGEQYDSLIQPFQAVYKRFSTPVMETWEITANPSPAEVDALVEEIKQLDIGSLFIAANPRLSAVLVKRIRQTGSILDIFGPPQLASSLFLNTLEEVSGEDAKAQVNGIATTTPILFDTANDEAQRFQSSYEQTFGKAPDWMAALAYDAAHISLMEKGEQDVRGITGSHKIVEGRVDLPLQMGIYNGDSLISAPIQMLPIARGTNFNYVDALKDGRVLYVNDRFMFKTNVVYTGFTINEIKNVDRHAETADVDMTMWFRYQGDFKPEDVQVLNAGDSAIEFGEPEEESNTGDVKYRRYRIEESFKLNFTNDRRAYDHHIAGISFRHRLLNRNNLMYVVDVLGMPTGNEFISDLKNRKVTESGSGWVVDNAWVSQDVEIERGEGAPQYVGITGEEPLFSTITLGIEIKPATLSARDVISIEYFIYIAIFGVLGVIFANLLDMRKREWYWAVQSWVLRVIFWPMLLLSAGNLLVDWSYINLAQSTTSKIVMTYEALWWLLAAHLANLAVLRFVWTPLENRAQRKIPNVMKILVTILLFSFAMAGIIGTVFNQPLTSFLATSGVLAMIVGFAVQANIANIFSGIILNIERPFKVGDFIKINNVIGQVRDITWRTVRIESNEGPMVSLANSNVSESFMENYTEVPHGIRTETLIYTPPDVDTEKMINIIDEAIADNEEIICKDDPMYEPRTRFKGIENLNGQWVGKFSAGYRVKILPKKTAAQQDLWLFIQRRCAEEGINLILENVQSPVITPPATPA